MIASRGVRPTEEVLKAGWEKNPHGAGAAWREKRGEKTIVRWKKGMELKEIIELNKTLTFPYILHFRAASANTMSGPHGCHPFPVNKGVSTALEGAADKVLFHNGFWSKWRDKLVEIAEWNGLELPGGGWTDTRALAWAGFTLGPGYLELMDQKLVIFAKDDLDIYGSGWERENDIVFSNMSWKPTGNIYTTPPASMAGGTGGSSHISRFPERQAEQTQGLLPPARNHAHHCGYYQPPRQSADDQGTVKEAVQKGDEEAARQALGDKEVRASYPLAPVPFKDPPAKAATTGEMCQDCNTSVATIHVDGYKRCWKCWQVSIRSGKKAAAGTTEVVPKICGFCAEREASAETRIENRPICSFCWVRLNRPAIITYSAEQVHEDILLQKRQEDARKGIVTIGRM